MSSWPKCGGSSARVDLHDVHRGQARRQGGLPGRRRDGFRREPGVAPGALVDRRDVPGHLPFQVRATQRGRKAHEEPRTASATRSAAASRSGTSSTTSGRSGRGRWTSGTSPPTTTPRTIRSTTGAESRSPIGPGVTWTLSRTFALDASVRCFFWTRSAARSSRGRDDQRSSRGHARDVPVLAGGREPPERAMMETARDLDPAAILGGLALVWRSLALLQACGESSKQHRTQRRPGARAEVPPGQGGAELPAGCTERTP